MPGPLRKMTALLASFMVAGCSGTDALNALVSEDGFTVRRDIAYGPAPRQRLDLYVPKDAGPGSPLLVFFYGGRWNSGSKDQYLFAAQAFAERGYVTAVPDYRLYPDVRWRGFLADAAAATAKAMAVVEAGSRPVYLAGHSAGAYMAMMIALDPAWLADAGVERRPDAVVGLAGPYDFLPLKEADLRDTFGPGPAGPETQPITFAGGDDPPVLLLHGDGDRTVLPRNSGNLARALNDAGGRATVKYYDGVGHVRLVAALAKPLRFLTPVLEDADSFLRDITARGRVSPSPRPAPAAAMRLPPSAASGR